VHINSVGFQLDRDIAVSPVEIQEVIANHLAFVNHAQHKRAETEAGIMFHDVKTDRGPIVTIGLGRNSVIF
jgi:hypothetical protein